VAALGSAPDAPRGVLEIDERWLPPLLGDLNPEIVLLGNLSRDQLDRTQEVRKLADGWRAALDGASAAVVANADDPLVVWGAGSAASVCWVGAGSGWRADASACPACGERLRFEDPATSPGPGGAWACTGCDLARPTLDAWIDDGDVVWSDGTRIASGQALPGRANAENAALALVAARSMGADPARAAEAMGRVQEVAGRYRRTVVAGITTRLLLAKNPAGWAESLDMAIGAGRPVIAAINARIADGRDPSWLWDVPFERLRGRFVVAAGERALDLAVRLRYAEVDHATFPGTDLGACVRLAAEGCGRGADAGAVDAIGNYTAFQDWLDEVGRDG
jgi:UDP-N-acetylmuramyl tripeptide synthase